MALQTSGAISFANLQTEFGGSHPITMGEYSTYRVSGSGNTISMNQFHGASLGYVLTQGLTSAGTIRGHNASVGSISPTTYSGATISAAYMLVVTIKGSTSYTMIVNMTGNRAKSFFTTFAGGGQSVASSASTHSQTGGNTYWTWSVSSQGDWDGSGNITVSIT